MRPRWMRPSAKFKIRRWTRKTARIHRDFRRNKAGQNSAHSPDPDRRCQRRAPAQGGPGRTATVDDPAIAKSVIERLDGFDDETRPAASSCSPAVRSGAEKLLDAVDAGKVPERSIPQDVLGKIKTYKGKTILEMVQKHWGGERVATTAEMQEQIRHYAAAVRSGSGDPYEGRALFTKTCAVCHKLFGQGAQIGPDLTPYKRDDLETMLLNIVNPSAEIREGYENYYVTTKDDRTLSGFLADKDDQVVVLRGLDGETKCCRGIRSRK